MLFIRPFVKLLSLLPLRLLYVLSSVLHPLIYHLFTYRRVTVRRNLSMSFPDYSSEEIRRIEKNFYKHFADLIAEGIKSLSISPKEIKERVSVTNLDQLKAFISEGKSVCGILGHMGNWEWAILRLAQEADFPVHALYQPSSNKSFDKWLKKSRERFGALLMSTREMRPLLMKIQDHPIALGTLGDQTPVNVDRCHWMTFLKQTTPVYTGPEKMARNYNMAVFYVSIHKTGRGYYHVRFDLITDQPDKEEDNAITETHTRMLEASILKQPEIWLWTHRRWKRSHLKPGHFK